MKEKVDLSIKMFGINLFSKRQSDLLKILDHHLDNSSKTAYIVTPNPEQIIISQQKNESGIAFLSALQAADFAIPDGVGLVVTSRLLHRFQLLSQPLQERITGADVVVALIKCLQHKATPKKPLSALIIGGRGYDQSVIRQWESDTFSLHWLEAYADSANPSATEEKKVVTALQKLQPTVVFVALGAPTQELWLQSHKDQLAKAKTSIAMAVGGSFDYLFGVVPRAPKVLQNSGLEWLYRLAKQPWRWKRQLRLFEFILLVIFRIYTQQPQD